MLCGWGFEDVGGEVLFVFGVFVVSFVFDGFFGFWRRSLGRWRRGSRSRSLGGLFVIVRYWNCF